MSAKTVVSTLSRTGSFASRYNFVCLMCVRLPTLFALAELDERTSAVFRLEFEELGVVGEFLDADGLEGTLAGTSSDVRLVRLFGGKLRGELLAWAASKTRWKPSAAGNAVLSYMARDNSVIYSAVLTASPAVAVELTDSANISELVLVAQPNSDFLAPQLVAMARRWRARAPSPYEWACMAHKEKVGWLALCRHAAHRNDEDRRRGEFVVEGQYVTDKPSLYLALGEAVNGPRGYYGASLDALEDCLLGGFGAVPPFTLRFKCSEAARQSLRTCPSDGEMASRTAESYWETFCDVLKRRTNVLLE